MAGYLFCCRQQMGGCGRVSFKNGEQVLNSGVQVDVHSGEKKTAWIMFIMECTYIEIDGGGV
ncbi:hypothetical protein YWY31_34260 [Paenibacillus illinoisensis]